MAALSSAWFGGYRRRRRAPPLHGAQDGAAQGRAQAARGLGCREVWILGGNLGGMFGYTHVLLKLRFLGVLIGE